MGTITSIFTPSDKISTVTPTFKSSGGGNGMQDIPPDTMLGKLFSKVNKVPASTPVPKQADTPELIPDQAEALNLKMDELNRLVNKLSSAGDGFQTGPVSYNLPQEHAPILSSLPDNNRAATVSEDGDTKNTIIILIAAALILGVLFLKTKQVM